MKRFCLAESCLTLIFLTASAHAQTSQSWGPSDRAAFFHVRDSAKNFQTTEADLSDPKTAQFVRRQLELSGYTASRYPGLYSMFSNKKSAKSLKKFVIRQDPVNDDVTHYDVATTLYSLYPSSRNIVTGQTIYLSEGAATVETRDVPNVVLTSESICFYDANGNPVGTCVSKSSFSSYLYAPISNGLATDELNSFTAVIQAIYYDSSSGTSHTQTSSATINQIDFPDSQTAANPIILNTGNPHTLVCATRSPGTLANPGTCDYGQAANQNIIFSVQGTETFKSTQTPQVDANGHLVGTATISLSNLSGGACRVSPSISGANFFSQPGVTYDQAAKVLSWNIANLDFGSAENVLCGSQGDGLIYDLQLTVNDSASQKSIVASQESELNTTIPHYAGTTAVQLLVPSISVVAGCLGPDTLITLSDGKTLVPISQITGANEKILSVGGVSVPVSGVTHGIDKTLYKIVAANNKSVLATAKHPFILADGSIRIASALRLKDKVMTDGGPSEIVSVVATSYQGKVFNLTLAPTLKAISARGGTFYANGFLVGDNEMQKWAYDEELSRADRIKPVIPKGFEKDYASAVADHKIFRRGE